MIRTSAGALFSNTFRGAQKNLYIRRTLYTESVRKRCTHTFVSSGSSRRRSRRSLVRSPSVSPLPNAVRSFAGWLLRSSSFVRFRGPSVVRTHHARSVFHFYRMCFVRWRVFASTDRLYDESSRASVAIETIVVIIDRTNESASTSVVGEEWRHFANRQSSTTDVRSFVVRVANYAGRSTGIFALSSHCLVHDSSMSVCTFCECMLGNLHESSSAAARLISCC